jgi:hypothetical protein
MDNNDLNTRCGITDGGASWSMCVVGCYTLDRMPANTLAMADLSLWIAGARMRVRGWRVIRERDGEIRAAGPRVWSQGKQRFNPLITLPSEIAGPVNDAVMAVAAVKGLIPAEAAGFSIAA